MCPTGASEMNGTETDCIEFRILMAYAQRRRPELKAQRSPEKERPSPAAREHKASETSKTKKRRGWKKLIPKCVRPQEEELSEQPPTRDQDEEQYTIQRLVELLKESGDELNQEIKTDKYLSKCFKEAYSYSFFKKVTDMFLERVCSSAAQEPDRIAFTADITAKLTTVDNHPMNQSMGFGVKYLREHFSIWAESHGGWQKALNNAEEEEVE
ncbi:apoptosis facilitator Bcl-2-like protein 14 isoform X2 [Polyodon spathula]|uniref:apoptosis facilitator Bcl-2-like protein 14 isoform X2 n=1 Tax=Polyodon spathula TaxID=7913 RepID=UPI001B7E8C5A|nr:apoptosis facilitator Bcl-2-like protein 14 isoform X2 [Polyodon spathula]